MVVFELQMPNMCNLLNVSIISVFPTVCLFCARGTLTRV